MVNYWERSTPNSPVRFLIVLNPKIKKGFQFKDENEKSKVKNPAWSKMLAKVFKIDVTQCIHCTGTLRPIAAIKDRDEIIRDLKHEGIDYEPPEKAPAKYRHQSLRFDPEEPPGDASETYYYIDETD